MKSENTQSVATKIIQPICDELGYVLVEVTYKKELTGMVLSIVIDKPEGVNINDCERLSRALDQPLDDFNISNDQPYNLNVSSYGLDRSLKNDYDFNKFRNKFIIIKFYQPFEGTKEIKCLLISHSDSSITISYDNKETEIELKKIANIKPYIEF